MIFPSYPAGLVTEVVTPDEAMPPLSLAAVIAGVPPIVAVEGAGTCDECVNMCMYVILHLKHPVLLYTPYFLYVCNTCSV